MDEKRIGGVINNIDNDGDGDETYECSDTMLVFFLLYQNFKVTVRIERNSYCILTKTNNS